MQLCHSAARDCRETSQGVCACAQVYGESMHLVEVTSSLINHTVVNSPELQQLLPESLRNAQGAFDSMLGDAYLYGRQWISGAVRKCCSLFL